MTFRLVFGDSKCANNRISTQYSFGWIWRLLVSNEAIARRCQGKQFYDSHLSEKFIDIRASESHC